MFAMFLMALSSSLLELFAFSRLSAEVSLKSFCKTTVNHSWVSSTSKSLTHLADSDGPPVPPPVSGLIPVADVLLLLHGLDAGPGARPVTLKRTRAEGVLERESGLRRHSGELGEPLVRRHEELVVCGSFDLFGGALMTAAVSLASLSCLRSYWHNGACGVCGED